MDDANRLCLSCGLCCTSLIFGRVKVRPEEEARIASLGFEVQDGSFDMPCPKLCEKTCSIYEERPQSCDNFRCELLKALDGGDVPFAKASAIVDEAVALYDKLLQHFPNQVLPPRAAWDARVERWHGASPEERMASGDSAAIFDFTRLNLFLDKHFRKDRN